jgi:hypothetical protein
MAGKKRARKKKVATLKGIGREIEKTQKQLRKAKRGTTREGRKQLDLQIGQLETIKSQVIKVCRPNSWLLLVPTTIQSKG